MERRKGNRWTALAALPVLAAALILPLRSAEAASCTPAQTAALEVKNLQTELMVAALACGDRSGYNAFVSKFQSHLAPQGAALKSAFANGKKLDAFVTDLANAASQRHIQDVNGFCAQAAADFATLARVEGRNGLLRLAHLRNDGVLAAATPCALSSDILEASIGAPGGAQLQ